MLSAWSRGMIPPSGGGGLGFDSPSGPTVAFLLQVQMHAPGTRCSCPVGEILGTNGLKLTPWHQFP
mgnify:CR=1 FL=1